MMKFLRMLPVAVFSVLALSAVAVAGAASAKVCSKSGTGTSCGTGHGSVFTGAIEANLKTGTKAVVTLGSMTVSCSESGLGGSITNGETGTGQITSMTFGGCKTPAEISCPVTTSATVSSPWTFSLTTVAAPDGTMAISGFTGSFSCLGIVCRFRSASAGSKGEIVVTGGETAQIDAAKVPLEKEEVSSGACGATGQFSAEYTVRNPDSLYLT